jgi:hypothetical protein
MRQYGVGLDLRLKFIVTTGSTRSASCLFLLDVFYLSRGFRPVSSLSRQDA